jgi:hypothetical protein
VAHALQVPLGVGAPGVFSGSANSYARFSTLVVACFGACRVGLDGSSDISRCLRNRDGEPWEASADQPERFHGSRDESHAERSPQARESAGERIECGSAASVSGREADLAETCL